jgi:hypothetical protein
MSELSLFERAFFEAPGDEDNTDNAPEETAETPDTEAPDVGGGDAPADDPGDEAPDDQEGAPDMDVQEDDYFGGDDGSTDNSEADDSTPVNLGLDDKVSQIMNMNLYQRFLTLLRQVSDQLNMIRSNADVMYSLSSDVDTTLSMLNKLDENVRLYLNNYFMNENYSKNLLFFNKCLNLLKLLNDQFDAKISKGIKELK